MYMKIVLVVLLAFLVQHIFKMYSYLDIGKQVYMHYPGPCHKEEGMGFGSENMHMLSNGITFITSGFGSKENMPGIEKFRTDNKVKGRIYLYDLENPKSGAKEMTLTSTKDFDKDRFQPHGISVWEDKKLGKLYLFVVNHEKAGVERVEKFLVSVEKLSLEHMKSFTNEAFTTLNDIAATGENSFYYTNFMHTTSNLGHLLETFALMSWSNVGFYDGSSSRLLVDGMKMANGIQMSLDGRYIYVLPSNNQQLRIYDRSQDNSLHLKQAYDLGTGPDNVVVDPHTGDLYIGLHPIGHKAMAHLNNPALRSPSQVLQVKLRDGEVSSVRELFVDDGNLISGSAVATVYKNRMLIGSVLDSLVYCDVNIPM